MTAWAMHVVPCLCIKQVLLLSLPLGFCHVSYLPLVWCCSFEDGLKLVKLRGESMQAAADSKPSAMVSVIGLSMDKVRPSHSISLGT